jgi:hypothetical protein
MKKNKKTGNWLRGLQKPNSATTSLSNTAENSTSNPKNAGKKAEKTVRSSNISLYDRCDITPLSIYIDVTCDDRLEKLVISGNPTRGELEEAKAKLTQEFSELCGNGETKILTENACDFFRKQNAVTGIDISIRLIASGKYEEAITFLSKSGIRCTTPENEAQAQSLITRLTKELKNRLAKLKEAKTSYEDSVKKGEKPTRQYYNRLLVTLSTCEIIKMQLDRNKLTLSEFAEYIHLFNEYQEQLKSIKNDRRKH